jgi:hypothetical protein
VTEGRWQTKEVPLGKGLEVFDAEPGWDLRDVGDGDDWKWTDWASENFPRLTASDQETEAH